MCAARDFDAELEVVKNLNKNQDLLVNKFLLNVSDKSMWYTYIVKIVIALLVNTSNGLTKSVSEKEPKTLVAYFVGKSTYVTCFKFKIIFNGGDENIKFIMYILQKR